MKRWPEPFVTATGMSPTIINLDWTPRLRAYQQRDGWQDQPVLGLYDDLQLATDVQERVLVFVI